jgi:hypothetical protein
MGTVTDDMVEAAERKLYEQADKFGMRDLSELHHDTVRLMVIAAMEAGTARPSQLGPESLSSAPPGCRSE